MPGKKLPITDKHGKLLGHFHSGFHNALKSLEPKLGSIGMGLAHHLVLHKYGEEVHKDADGEANSLHIDFSKVDKKNKLDPEEVMMILDSFITDAPVPKVRRSKKVSGTGVDAPKVEENTPSDTTAAPSTKKKKLKIGSEKQKIQEGPIPEIILK